MNLRPEEISDMVKAALPMYDISNYNDENIDQAKKDKAALKRRRKPSMPNVLKLRKNS